MSPGEAGSLGPISWIVGTAARSPGDLVPLLDLAGERRNGMDLESFEDVRPDLESLEGSHRLGRRSFLIGALATGAAVTAPVNYAAMARKRRIPAVKHAKFDLGVASGFPRPRGIELWTRLGEIKRTSKLSVVVATDRKFGNVVEEQMVTARRERDFTARTFIKGLKPDHHYFYRFVTKDSKSG